ncbi:MAG: rhodanese-like domain-containing protein [Proteobacteria bacterium]|nr:rhodanese-like domain-containing protein [Pseudomonadota bacterium]
MTPYITFLVEHWMLSTAFGVIVLLLIINEWRHRSFGIPGINPQQLVELLNHKEAVVVDVRATERFDLGHILGAMNIPAQNFGSSVKTLNKYKSKPVILVCAMGQESPKLGKLLKEGGFTTLYHLSGGMEAWHAQNLPVTKR